MNRILFVQGLPKKATRDCIINAFIIFGEILDVTLAADKNTCLVEFAEMGDASAALDNMHLSELFGQTIYVTYATKGNLLDRKQAVWEMDEKS